jgi:hypothetical protein
MAPKGRVAAATTSLHLHHTASYTWQIDMKVGPYESMVHVLSGHVHWVGQVVHLWSQCVAT